MTVRKAVLNVGGNNKDIKIPGHYDGWRHDLLDIDPRGNPDVLCDSRQMHTLAPGGYDAVYCSHNLEHYFAHDVPRVLKGFLHVLNPEGFAEVRVPDIGQVMREVVAKGLDIEDVLYQSAAGPITVKDVIYGWGTEIAASGNDFYAHRTGFTPPSLAAVLSRSGFGAVFTGTSYLEVRALAFKTHPSDAQRALFQLP
ncbi:MAG: class I SAM-dependent methyltransferase [Nitrospirae bacterium]|nr:class I SAM-dependent methyltransferase [Nitrospirota bacterium]